MPAPFAAQLCGYRTNGNPNTSDNHDDLSKVLGRHMFEAMGVPTDQVVGLDPGNDMEIAIVGHLAPRRPELAIKRSRSAADFEQYAHLSVYPDFRRAHQHSAPLVERLQKLVAALPPSSQAEALSRELVRAAATLAVQDGLVDQLTADMPEESFLKVDVTCGVPQGQQRERMALGLSSKWSLRTDRAQDCISQGSKLASQRRGPMPHFAVVTMEPRPAMLRILADGSGAIDCVYHLHLPALAQAINEVRASKPADWGPGRTFDRLVQQRRIRDYDELVVFVDSTAPIR